MRLTSCFVHIQWLRKRCMANSVARRPHTATSVRGLISPPSPSLVVCLLFTVFLSSPPHTCFHLRIPSSLILPSITPSPVFCLIIFTVPSARLIPHWLPIYWLPLFFTMPLLISFPPLRSLLLSGCVFVSSCSFFSACLFFAELYYCGWLERGDCCVAWSHWVNSWYWRVMESDNGKTQTKLKCIQYTVFENTDHKPVIIWDFCYSTEFMLIWILI